LQWISWSRFGRVHIDEVDGGLSVRGEQRDPKTGDYLTVDGHIIKVGLRRFTFDGEIHTRISHINGGRVCKRSGRMVFRATGKRKYFRLRQMDNPCDPVVDYVDIYFKTLPP
jgi:hypothetical protein